MHSRRLIQYGLALAAIVPLCAQATPLGAKAGAWETTVTTTMSGLPPGKMPKFTKEQLAKLPPERRAMMEKMQAMREGKPVTSTGKSCLKASDTMEKLMADHPDRPNCKRKIISQTSNSLEVEITCTGPRASHAHVKVEAVSPTAMVSTTDASGDTGFKLHADSKSRWLGSSCAGIAQR